MRDREVLDRLFSSVYEELRRLAGGVLRREYAPELSATTLVHEAWLKFARTPDAALTSPVESGELLLARCDRFSLMQRVAAKRRCTAEASSV